METESEFVCETCGPVGGTRVERREESYPVNGEDTTVSAHIRVCCQCGQDLFDRNLDSKNLQTAFDLYRRRHNIISPLKIRAMRERYGLSQRSLGALLGWGEVTIHRYEHGSLPDDAHNQVLQFIEDPFNMQYISDRYGYRLRKATLGRLTERLSELLNQQTADKVVQVLMQSANPKKVDIFTGFRKFKPEALMEMIVFFASKPAGVWKTKLNKLLWYSDFIHYRYHSLSISGATYVHLPYGPVPDSYTVYLGTLCESRTLNIQEVDFGFDRNGEQVTGEKLVSARPPRADALPPTAFPVLEAVHSYFEKAGSSGITKISHEEVGYAAARPGEPISYGSADDLKVNIPVED
jgi:putative zinc finger/helix-turn-helix YgiT family protein